MEDNLFTKKLKKDYETIFTLTGNEVKGEMESFFNIIIRYGYPDQDMLANAGKIAKLAKHNLDMFLISKLENCNNDFEKEMILWFLLSYWQGRTNIDISLLQKICKTIQVAITSKSFYLSKIYTLITGLKSWDNNLNSSELEDIKNYLKNELDIIQDNERLKKLRVYSLLKNIFNVT